jgi:hypothetical protein
MLNPAWPPGVIPCAAASWLKGEVSYGLLRLVLRDGFGGFLPQAPLHQPSDNEEASLLGCAPIGLLDEAFSGGGIQKSGTRGGLLSRPERPRLYGPNAKYCESRNKSQGRGVP